MDFGHIRVNDRRRLGLAVLALSVAVVLPGCYPTTAQPAHGAKPIGTTTYPVPASARFVSTAGRDTNPGTSAAPWRTLAKAVASAPSGATVVLRRGTYREDVDIPATKRLTLQPAANHAVWLSGSQVVTGWVGDGGDWRKDGWNHPHERTALNPTLIDPAYPYAGWPDMVFLNGVPLRQVGSRAAVTPGRFYVDYTNRRLYIGSNPSGKTAEASVLTEALNIRSSGTVVRGLGFRHYATHISRLGAVKGTGNSLTFENNVFSHNAAAGLSLRGDGIRVVSNTSDHNGQIGIHADSAARLLIERNRLSTNNIEHFYAAAAAGGVKVTASTDAVLRRNLVDGNFGHGLWLDSYSHRGTVVRNVIHHNQSAGILFEHSDIALLAGNTSYANYAGIMANEASYVEIWNNTVHDNVLGLAAYDGRRSPVPVSITVRNNVISNSSGSSRPMLLVEDINRRRTWSAMRFTSNANAWYRRSSTRTAYSAGLANGTGGKALYRSLPAMRTATRQDLNSLNVDNVPVNPFVANAAAGNLSLPAGSPAVRRGTPLPTRVATALGIRAGVAVNIGASV